MANPVRFRGGISTTSRRDNLALFEYPDPTRWWTYFDDFTTVTPENYLATISSTGTLTGSASVLYGQQKLTTAAGGSDSAYIMPYGLASNGQGAVSFGLASKAKIVFKARWNLTDGNSAATEVDAFIGFHTSSTTPYSATNYWRFRKTDNAVGTVVFETKTASASTSTVVGTMTSGTNVDVGFSYYRGTNSPVDLFFNGVKVASVIPVSVLNGLVLGWGVLAGRASASVLNLDYVFAAAERV